MSPHTQLLILEGLGLTSFVKFITLPTDVHTRSHGEQPCSQQEKRFFCRFNPQRDRLSLLITPEFSPAYSGFPALICYYGDVRTHFCFFRPSECGHSLSYLQTHHIVARRIGSCGRYFKIAYIFCIVWGQTSSQDIALKPPNFLFEDRHLCKGKPHIQGARERAGGGEGN